jgi:hypothetical protein
MLRIIWTTAETTLMKRHRLNGTWMALRGLASERKGAIITASHTGRQTVGGTRDAGDADLSEDIRNWAT